MNGIPDGGNPIPEWPVRTVEQTASRFLEQTLRARFWDGLTNLAVGRWTARDAADLRDCCAELATRRIGPWASTIRSAISDDGLSFSREGGIVLPSGSAFNAVRLPSGQTALVSVCFDPDALIARRSGAGRLDLAFSDDGLRFERDMRFRIVGLFTLDAVDPDIVLLPDGSLRLYLMAGLRAGDLKGKILSARSTDGHVFWQEPGVTYGNPFGGSNPKAIHVEGQRWKLFVHVDASDAGEYGAGEILDHNTIVSATSWDGGASFTVDEHLPALTGAVISAIRTLDGFRIYYQVPAERGLEIRSAYSSDGEQWREEKGVRLDGVRCPVVVAAGGGRYRMYYEDRGEQRG